jgi:hypothetical protein
MAIRVVTTFSNSGYKCYGKAFIASFLKHCPDTELVVYHESLESLDFLSPKLEWRNLDYDTDRHRFIVEHGSDPEKVNDARHPNRQSIRFCHKVFALTNEAVMCRDGFIDWLVWIDSDVLFHASPDWPSVLPDHAWLSFLGRKGVYTECGFVGYRVSQPKVQALLEDMRKYYTSGEIFRRALDDRHDSRCFDICRERSEVPAERQHNLSKGIIGTHVWPMTMLANFCTHQKGPSRKMQRYGGVVS